mgnify:CR=1 FL=1
MIGTLDAALSEALIDSLRVEMTIIDAENRVVGWNKHSTRAHKRRKAILGTDVLDCHSPASRPLVARMLEEMRSGQRDRAHFWIRRRKEAVDDEAQVLVEYCALRSPDGTYLGCAEVIEDLGETAQLKGETALPE